MTDKRELMKELKQKQREAQKAEDEFNKIQMSCKTSCIPELLLNNEKLREIILPLDVFEAEVIFAELINSDAFFAFVDNTIKNSSELVQKARKAKAAKAELRKQKSAARKETAAAQEVVLEEPYVFEKQTETVSETIQSSTEFENQTEF
ncbi:MAG: hypothetical protein NC253_01185 [Ruminococcus sp.]|nr:hypothetical protein [Ruminococcus sp.]MCM1382321.1 hypothetical protein [Muribaculaceae bacterium]MCM1480489.1 hypothetical protein [Muribaculaceae bacterium]